MNPRLKPKTCTTCGIIFIGGPTAKYCPSCRAERIKQRDCERHQRKLAGMIRRICSIDLCQSCGDEYTVNAGPQKYCPPCQEKEKRKRWQESFKLQYYGNPIKRQEMIERACRWAKKHPDRMKITSHRHYLNNKDAKTLPATLKISTDTKMNQNARH